MKNFSKIQTKSSSKNHDIAFLDGARVLLRSFVEADINDRYLRWFSDPVVCVGNSHNITPLTKAVAQQYLKQVMCDPSRLMLAIIVKDSNEHIGNIALNHINSIHHSAELTILIGEKNIWGQGYGTEASSLVLKYAFENLNLNRVYCGTYQNNAGMIRLAKKLSMQQEGLRRAAVFKNGTYLNVLEYGILKSEYIAIIQERSKG